MARIRRGVVITGVVQGVGFRYSARAEAERLGIDGWVRNRPDGAVEAEVEGESGPVQRMLAWLERGPAGARVDDLVVTELDPRPEEHGFRVTR